MIVMASNSKNEIWKSWSWSVNLNKTVVLIRSGFFKMCWILPDSSPESRILYTSAVQSECDQHCCPCDHTQTITWSRGLAYWFLHQENRNELKNWRRIASSQTNSHYLSKIDKNYTLWKKLFSKNRPKKHMNFDKTSPKKRNPLSSEISDFTPCTHAQSNILHIKYADKTYY